MVNISCYSFIFLDFFQSSDMYIGIMTNLWPLRSSRRLHRRYGKIFVYYLHVLHVWNNKIKGDRVPERWPRTPPKARTINYKCKILHETFIRIVRALFLILPKEMPWLNILWRSDDQNDLVTTLHPFICSLLLTIKQIDRTQWYAGLALTLILQSPLITRIYLLNNSKLLHSLLPTQ